MKQFTWAQRLRYWFDNLMARGSIALIAWLFIISAILILLVSLILAISGNTAPDSDGAGQQSFLETVWTSLMHTIDAGTIAGDSTGDLFYLVMMFIITAGGIFIFSTLIGLLSSGIDAQLEELRKGRSIVVEQNHTIILGWSSQIFSVIEELVIANENKRYACIAILAEKDKIEMEEAIFGRVADTLSTRIVCRTGSPIDVNDLAIMNPDGARSIIVLSDEAEDPDAYVIKCVLALTNNPQRRSAPYHIVAEINDPQNLEVANLIAPGEASILPVRELMARLTVQTSQQSGLSSVYMDLLNYQGSEIYFHAEPRLAGQSFYQAMLSYERAAVMGYKNAAGKILLNPPIDYALQASDTLIVLAEDDDKIIYTPLANPPLQENQMAQKQTRPAQPERVLILGWNSQGPGIITELDYYLEAGSEVQVVTEQEAALELLRETQGGLKNYRLQLESGSITNRRVLDRLNIPTFNHVITLSDSDRLQTQQADAKTLITLLHLRDIQDKSGAKFSIVSEMLDLRNRQLAEVTRADDFIVGDRLVSLMLSQVAEQADLMDVFLDLFSSEGSEIYLRPITDYVRTGVPVNFYTLTAAAARYNEVALGYRLMSQAKQANKAYGVHINPPKLETLSYQPEDKLIVLAAD